MKQMLDIIVTHYNEPWEIGRPFFDMLSCQRGIDFNDIRVILVHDGTELFDQKYFARYPYRVAQYRIKHGGVSMARNYGLDVSDADWVEFCDFDDCYTNIYGLRMILSHLTPNVDYVWTPFFMEIVQGKEMRFKTHEKENIVWVHGKYFRREFLIENNLRFPEGIHYSEDSGFCAIVNEVTKLDRRGKIKTDFPVYSWVYREGSVTTDKINNERNLTGFIDRNTWVVEEFKRRGIDHIGMVGRMFADAYWAFHRKSVQFPEQEKRFANIGRNYLEDLEKNSPETMREIMRAAIKIFKPSDLDDTEGFGDWLKRLYEKRGEQDGTENIQYRDGKG